MRIIVEQLRDVVVAGHTECARHVAGHELAQQFAEHELQGRITAERDRRPQEEVKLQKAMTQLEQEQRGLYNSPEQQGILISEQQGE